MIVDLGLLAALVAIPVPALAQTVVRQSRVTSAAITEGGMEGKASAVREA